MSQVQSGILPEHYRAAIWIEANLKGDVNALREASKIFVDNVATFQAFSAPPMPFPLMAICICRSVY